MRIHLLAALALVVPACAGDITSPGGGGGPGGPVCGNGVVETGEQCDDGNTTAGDGCSAMCTMEQVATPKVSATVDKPTVSTELAKTETLTYTITGTDGFAGQVNVAATAADAQGNPITTGITLTPSAPSVTLTQNGTGTVSVDVAIASDNQALSPTVKLALSSSAAPSDVTSTFTIANRVTITIDAGTGTGSPHTNLPLPSSRLTIHNGTQLVFHNADGTLHRIHGDGGITHEPDELQTGSDYTVTPTTDADWYCHDHEGTPQARLVSVIP